MKEVQLFKYDTGDVVRCIKLPEHNFEELVIGNDYVVTGASVHDGNEVYSLKDEKDRTVYSMDHFRYVRRAKPQEVTNKLIRADVSGDYSATPTLPVQDTETKFDVVEKPKHYADRMVEVITYIEDNMSPEAYRGYLEGNLIKYVSRYKTKNGKQDLLKAKWYLERLISKL